MAKRRTKKQKATARQPFLISWKEDKSHDKKASFEPDVKGQTKKNLRHNSASKKRSKMAYPSGKVDGLASVRKDIIKSLSLASLIVGIEVVLYLIW